MPPTHQNRSKRNPRPVDNPTPAQIRAAREAAGLTQEQAAELVYVGLRAWQRYEDARESTEWRPMHPSMWELFNIKLAQRRTEATLAQIPTMSAPTKAP